jgi:hypothetical protein
MSFNMHSPQGTFVGNRYSYAFVVVTAVFITCLVTANITAVKLINLSGLILPAAVIIFPISYIFGDVLTEVYGYRQARRVIWLGFGCNLLVVMAIWFGQLLPSAAFWDGQGTLLEETRQIEEHLNQGTYETWYQEHIDNSIYRPLIDYLLSTRRNSDSPD